MYLISDLYKIQLMLFFYVKRGFLIVLFMGIYKMANAKKLQNSENLFIEKNRKHTFHINIERKSSISSYNLNSVKKVSKKTEL